MIVVYLLLLIGFSLLLIKATDIVSDSLQDLSSLTHLAKFALTSLLLALATSFPELVVAVTAALKANSNLSLGLILGSNIANLSIVVGGAAIIGGTLSVTGQFLRLDVFSVFLAGVMPLILLLDGQLSRIDGLVLLILYFIFDYGILKEKPRDFGEAGGRFKLIILKNKQRLRRIKRHLLWLIFGVILLLVSGNLVVKTAGTLATALHVPIFLIAMFMLAIGATLPELSLEARAIKKHQAGMVLGTLLGSIVVNSTLILGTAILISPIKVITGLNAYLLAAMAFGLMFLLFWFFVRSKKKLERWEGAVLVLAYLVFAAAELLTK